MVVTQYRGECLLSIVYVFHSSYTELISFCLPLHPLWNWTALPLLHPSRDVMALHYYGGCLLHFIVGTCWGFQKVQICLWSSWSVHVLSISWYSLSCHFVCSMLYNCNNGEKLRILYLVCNLCQTPPFTRHLVVKEHSHWVTRLLMLWHHFGLEKQALKDWQCSQWHNIHLRQIARTSALCSWSLTSIAITVKNEETAALN